MKVAIVYYSTYGHVLTLAKSIKKGLESSGKVSQVDILQVPETLSKDILQQLHAPEKPNYPLATPEKVAEYDAILFGYPTRFGNLPAQLVEFFGQTGGLWTSGGLYRKPVGVFTSVSSSGGGQEVTMRNLFSYVAHHGMVFIPLGYGKAFPDITNLEEVHGGSPYGAATFAGANGSRQPSDLELRIAHTQGETFAASAAKLVAASKAPAATKKTAPAAAEKKTAQSTSPATKTTEKSTEASTPQRVQKLSTPNAKEESSCAKCVIV
ncbi:NAD(P)H:quinone oxidoreductase, type IV [Candidozyma pseudohaemuli]|uniref:NAD(P)H:quinone oxidoreductase, type IV n=1 Tax=Candidozyma pseudohaemuli TaxID=418784 RepID=A0A2P7YMH0_9ASCO|nr:NAD(P)H:quinone oxidoreductase, type IV [[Candida] pseudohaemulonii]PSK37164.1 NAD(P)H:quinone oxidoreductase, type IV [[Candida] pseudohaemulonii]